MKIIVTKEELLDYCSACAEKALKGYCVNCIFESKCNGVYIDFWRDYTEIKE